MNRFLHVLCCAGSILAAANRSEAKIRLPAIISYHMVLQSGVAAPIWGWGEPGETVTVSIAGQTRTAVADARGRWKLALAPLAPGGPHTLTVAGSSRLEVDDVLVGEVWIGAGQSNMGFPFKMDFFPFLTVKDYPREKAAANFPRMRMFIVETAGVAAQPQEDCRGSWHLTKPENVDSFSAELYFFGRELHRTLDVPVGLIKSAVGGTAIDLWVDAAAQRTVPELAKSLTAEEKDKNSFDLPEANAQYRRDVAKWQQESDAAKAAGQKPPRHPGDPVALWKRNFAFGGLFNSKIAPLIPYAIRGVVWHQGETDAGSAERAPLYRLELPLLISDWRRRWGYDFPFAWVQLANLDLKNGDWPAVREAMLQTLRLPHTGMAVTIDIGEAHNIHFINKQEVGHRLALWALGSVYGKGTPTSGPLPAGSQRTGAAITIAFSHAEGGLVAKGGELRGFVIAGADGAWHAARARIDGDHVIVSSPEVVDPVAVRYAWAPNPECNLYNAAGLPASPFRTDQVP